MLKRAFSCALAALTLCFPSFAQENPTDSPAPRDSVMVIVDGVLAGSFEHAPVTPLELALLTCPILSADDIDDVELIDGLSQNSRIIACTPPKDCLIITTRKESAIYDFILDGKPILKRRGIDLGCLLDQECLLRAIEKNWRIKPERIVSLRIEGRTIRIMTKPQIGLSHYGAF